MSTPIPITFSRELPTEPGLWLWRGQDVGPHVHVVRRGADDKFYAAQLGNSWAEFSTDFIGGEWCGPLQLIEAKDGEKESE